jgi:hypothetical protein
VALPLLLRTDRRGRILAVEGGGELAGLFAPGGTLAPLVADSGATALFDFLLGLRRGGAALACDLPAAPATAAAAVHVAGVAAGETSWIAVARERAGLLAWCRTLVEGRERPLAPEPSPSARERLGVLLGEVPPAAGEVSAERGEAVARLERLLEEKDREIAALRDRLARLEAER